MLYRELWNIGWWCEGMRHYYVPKSKRELVKYLQFYCLDSKKLIKKDKEQLYAIFYGVREKFDKLSNSFMEVV